MNIIGGTRVGYRVEPESKLVDIFSVSNKKRNYPGTPPRSPLEFIIFLHYSRSSSTWPVGLPYAIGGETFLRYSCHTCATYFLPITPFHYAFSLWVIQFSRNWSAATTFFLPPLLGMNDHRLLTIDQALAMVHAIARKVLEDAPATSGASVTEAAFPITRSHFFHHIWVRLPGGGSTRPLTRPAGTQGPEPGVPPPAPALADSSPTTRCARATLSGARCTLCAFFPFTLRATHYRSWKSHGFLPHWGATVPGQPHPKDAYPRTTALLALSTASSNGVRSFVSSSEDLFLFPRNCIIDFHTGNGIHLLFFDLSFTLPQLQNVIPTGGEFYSA